MRRMVLAAVLVVGWACGPAPETMDPRAFEGLYRAAAAIEHAMTAGVSYPRFTELVVGFTTELALAAPHVRTDAERELLTRYRQAAEPLGESLQIWSVHLARGQYLRRGVAGPADSIFSKYGMAPGGHELWDLSTGREALWRRALVDLAMARRVYESAPRSGP